MNRSQVLVGLLLALPAAVGAQTASPTVHELRASPTTIHRWFFDASLPPVLSVNSGDFVRLWTATGNPRYFEAMGMTREQIPPELYAVFQGIEGQGREDHTLNGPIAVRDALPGDVLEVRILSVDVWLPLAGIGFAGGGVLAAQFPYVVDRPLRFTEDKRAIAFAPGIEIPTRPFWGIIGVAPPIVRGRVPSPAPGLFGGNMDNPDLGAGSIVYLPVHVPGALLSVGDGHAAQGYGEVAGGAAEASLEGEIQIILHKDRRIRWPRAETPTHYMTMGLHADLDEAARIATSEMVAFLVAEKNLTPDDAYLICSLAMNLVVTQVVDGTKGIHAMIPKAIFTR